MDEIYDDLIQKPQSSHLPKNMTSPNTVASSALKHYNWPTLYCLCEVLDLHQNLPRHLAGAWVVCHWSFKGFKGGFSASSV